MNMKGMSVCNTSHRVISFPSLIYITDWFATMLQLAGLSDSIPDNVDSIDMWPVLSTAVKTLKKGPRQEIVLNIDQDNRANTWSAAIM